jgi:hypothetical protein
MYWPKTGIHKAWKQEAHSTFCKPTPGNTDTIVGLEVNQWMYEDQQIDRFIDLGTQLLNGIKKNV